MLALSGSDANGTITYFVPPEHTAMARKVLGPDKWICAEQAVMLERDASKARAAARNYMKTYLRIPAYLNYLPGLDFTGAALVGPGSGRLAGPLVSCRDER